MFVFISFKSFYFVMKLFEDLLIKSQVKKWVKELRKMLGAENISLVIAGNKTDLEKQRQVDGDTAKE